MREVRGALPVEAGESAHLAAEYEGRFQLWQTPTTAKGLVLARTSLMSSSEYVSELQLHRACHVAPGHAGRPGIAGQVPWRTLGGGEAVMQVSR